MRSTPHGRQRRMRSVALAAALSLALAGCGGGDDDLGAVDDDGATDTEANAEDDGGTDGATADGEPIVIGVVTSRTGDLAPTGVQVWAGVALAVQEINDQGGIDGRPVELVVEDDRSNPTDALNAVQKLTSENDPVAVWGPTFTPLVLAMEPAVVEAQIPVFVSATAPVVTQQGDGWFFRTRTNDVKTGEIAAQFAVEDLDASEIAFLYPNNDFGTGGYNIISPAIEELGAAEVAAEVYNQGDRDLSAQLLSIQRSGADLLIPWTVPVDSALLVNQADEFGLEIPILGGPGYATEEYLDLVGEATAGNYALADAAIASEDVGGRDAAWGWVESFKQAHPDVPVSFVSSVAYDSASMLFDVLAGGTASDGESLRTALRDHAGYEGVSGTFECDDENNCLHQADVIHWEGTTMELVDTIVMPPE
jgi:branched-chain amino acid transport system substrate-binding protein